MAYSELFRKSVIDGRLLRFFFSVLLFAACSTLDPQQPNTTPVSHSLWSDLLRRYVDEGGFVDYDGFQADRQKLRQYLQLLVSNPPNDERWNSKEKLAYWINLYNAYTIELVLEHLPLKSIKDIGSSIQVPFVNTPWDIKFIEISGKKYDLNNIEHNILRKIFDEPRIHFAINCASTSCPKLRREAYTAEALEEQLQEQAIDFLNDPEKNLVTASTAEVSKIFQWFSGDFTKNGSLREFINQYSRIELTEGADIDYMDYDWSLNDTK